LIDEIHGVIEELKTLIKCSDVPVMCICDDPWSKGAKSIKGANCKEVPMNGITTVDIQRVLTDILNVEKPAYPPTKYNLAILSSVHNGDLRSCINALQFNVASDGDGPSTPKDSGELNIFNTAKQFFTSRRMPDDTQIDCDLMAEFVHSNYIDACSVGAFGIKGKTDMDTLGRISKCSEELSRYSGVDNFMACWAGVIHCHNVPDRPKLGRKSAAAAAVKKRKMDDEEATTTTISWLSPSDRTYHESWTK
jgi:hypothetical protein